jgi:hypothetical protein
MLGSTSVIASRRFGAFAFVAVTVRRPVSRSISMKNFKPSLEGVCVCGTHIKATGEVRRWNEARGTGYWYRTPRGTMMEVVDIMGSKETRSVCLSTFTGFILKPGVRGSTVYYTRGVKGVKAQVSVGAYPLSGDRFIATRS